MKCIVVKASDENYEVEVELNTIEDLMNFMKQCGHSLIISSDYETDRPMITIYDDYLE